MRRVHLKIKIKSLAAEAVIIRQEEHKYKRGGFSPDNSDPNKRVRRFEMYNELRQHRVVVLRDEARHSQLAYAFLRGRPYSMVEAKCREEPAYQQIASIVCRFSEANIQAADAKEAVKKWLKNEPVGKSPNYTPGSTETAISSIIDWWKRWWAQPMTSKPEPELKMKEASGPRYPDI